MSPERLRASCNRSVNCALLPFAAAAGFYETGGNKFPKIQILTIEDLFDGRNVQIPFGFAEGFRKPAKEKVELQKMLF